MSGKNGYNGQIKNTGTQEVKAPNNTGGSTKGTIMHRGTDLRSSGKKK